MTESSSNGQTSLSFMQGFISGQIFILIVLGFVLKFFIFGEVPSSTNKQPRRRTSRAPSFTPYSVAATVHSGPTAQNPSSFPPPKSNILRKNPPLTAADILKKTYYNVQRHQPESVDWFNVLIAQTIAQLRADAQQDDAILTSLTDLMNGPRRPDFLDEIRVTEINLGDEFPIFSNCRIIPIDSVGQPRKDIGVDPGSRPGSSAEPLKPDFGRLQARMDVDLSDAITLGIETKLVLNYPKPLVAVMPVALAVTVVRFSGTLSISFIPSSQNLAAARQKQQQQSQPKTPHDPPPGDPTPPTTLTFSFLPDYRLELSVHSLMGSKARLQDVPKIGQLVEARLHEWFDERCVEPRFQQVALPSLWPRKHNTRGGNGGGEDKDSSHARTPSFVKRSANRPGGTPDVSPPRFDPLQKAGLNVATASALESDDDDDAAMKRRKTQAWVATGGMASGDRANYHMPGEMPS